MNLALLLLAAALCASPPPPATRISPATPVKFAPGWIPLGVAAVTLAAFALGRAGVIIAGCMVAATIVHVVQARRADRAARTRSQIAATFIGHLAEAVEAGSLLPDAAARAADHLPAATPAQLRSEIAQFTNALRNDAAPPPCTTPELARVCALWKISAARGVPIAGLLAAARDEIDTALRHRAATDAALAGPKTTAVVLAALPLAGIAMGGAMGAHPVAFLTGPGIGGLLLIIGSALVCAGVVVSGEIIRRAAA